MTGAGDVAGAGGSRKRRSVGSALTVLRARAMRPGETLYALLALIWAAELYTITYAPFLHYLTAIMGQYQWATLLAVLGIAQTAALLYGDLRPRAVCAFVAGITWGIVGVEFVIVAHGATLFGPTMLVFSAGGFLTAGRLIRLHRTWPL